MSIDEIVKMIAGTVREAVDAGIEKAMLQLEPRLKAIEEREIPAPITGEEIAGIVDDQITKALAALPVPKDGADGTSIDVAEVAEMLQGMLSSEMKKLSEGDEISSMVDASVKAAVDAIEKPKDGHTPTDQEIKKFLAEIFVPEFDRFQEISDERIDERVKAAVDAISIPEPKHGEDGRDAVQIEILPAIDEAKSYARGTYASHDGGLWRSYERTHGMKGWECIVDGVSLLDVSYDGERSVSVKIAKASGALEEKNFTMPMVIDRGVWSRNNTYKRFDGVTSGGSFWICQKDDPSGSPGDGTDDFRLSVKRGRDAKQPVKASA